MEKQINKYWWRSEISRFWTENPVWEKTMRQKIWQPYVTWLSTCSNVKSSSKAAVQTKRFKAAWDRDYLLKVLTA